MPPPRLTQSRLNFNTRQTRQRTAQDSSHNNAAAEKNGPDYKPANAAIRKRLREEVDQEEPLNARPAKQFKTNDAIDANPPSPAFVVDEDIGDLFASAPKNAILVHACNCQGSWGGGIALAFRSKYPKAYSKHREHCMAHVRGRSTKSLLGTAQLIPPVAGERKTHFVGCVFTSDRYGRARDAPDAILAATRLAMRDLLVQINDWNAEHYQTERISAVYMCKINSGLFNVPWSDTRAVLESMDIRLNDMEQKIMVRDRT